MPKPGTITDEVRYYPDPLQRLVQLHAGFSELTTGVSWSSPWPATCAHAAPPNNQPEEPADARVRENAVSMLWPRGALDQLEAEERMGG